MSVSLNELSYRILLIVRPKISDDESIDISEIRYDIETTRALLTKRRYSNTFRHQLPESIVQSIKNIEIEYVNSSSSPITSRNIIMRSVNKIPKIMEYHSGMPMVKNISTATILSNNFTMITQQQASSCGNGKFNQHNIFCFYEDDYLYFITRRMLFKGVKYINLDAVFERPTSVFEYLNVYNNENLDRNSPYPISLDMVDDIEQIIVKNKLRIEAAQPIDDVNDSSDTKEVIQQ